MSQFKPVVSGVSKAIFLLVTHFLYWWSLKKIISYADDTTLYAEVTSPFDFINAANSLNRDLVKIQLKCSTWRMKLINLKTPSITINWSRIPQPPLTLCKIDLEVYSSLKLLGVKIDDKLKFEKHIRKIASYSQKLQDSWQ